MLAACQSVSDARQKEQQPLRDGEFGCDQVRGWLGHWRENLLRGWWQRKGAAGGEHHALRFDFTRRRTDGAGGFFGIERISKRTTRTVVGRVVVMATMISAQPAPAAREWHGWHGSHPAAGGPRAGALDRLPEHPSSGAGPGASTGFPGPLWGCRRPAPLSPRRSSRNPLNTGASGPARAPSSPLATFRRKIG